MVTKEEILEQLKQVSDPEIGMDIVNLGLVYDIQINGDRVYIKMTMTAPTCPVTPWILSQAQTIVENMEGVEAADVELVWEPPWNPSMMTDEAKEALNMG
ncbi:MAG: metal-sulfur cluster assembly factor [Candidatus Thermoplasmatota archaeon]|jgi:metal-sulfur cluster biosynthetic enzyme|nr:metal-sulfur cluster assembly factor [Candidatus Thermoplasmatota archaeon]MCL5989137.1 metal-sulfur cluster assembly factor [Candidatus Thermoplasmatota archaeon]MCL5990044.1 metal-sulfur cluster assembly factor [Candidatus Thermoplasmatota archaeon]MCW6168319.1 metal-sulfur cluster assembly factor [Thermoplasmatales archaeon]MCW6169780.1 metal-sulfur cluster assembly factor [Thermoplasmatales archaeon]